MNDIKESCLKGINSNLGYWVNPSSPKQVSELLYKRLKIEEPQKRAHNINPSTNKEHLEKMKDQHPVIPMILDYRAADKLKGSFSDRLLRMADTNQRVHDDLSQIRTTSGRLTASIMLLIPRGGELAPLLRECFIADDDCVFLTADYSQIELRVLAHMSQDPLMLDIYRKEGDIHTLTASEVFGVPFDKVDKLLHRRPAKVVNFGIVYGMTAAGLFEQLGQHGWSEDDCERLIKDWFKVYKGARVFMNDVWQQAKRRGFVTTMSGRRRLIPEVRSVHHWIRDKGLREAGNHPIQGSANEIMKLAMAQLWHHYKGWRKEFYIEPIVQVHDDLKWELEANRLDYVVPRIKETMESVGGLCIPTPVDMEVGVNWRDMEDL